MDTQHSHPILSPGTPLLGGEYVVVAHLGSGAFADVYHVVYPAMGDEAHFALKLIRPDPARGVASEMLSDYEQRFRLESALAAKIHDARTARAGREHVIQVYRVGRDEGTGAQCAVLELATGGSLADRLAERGPLSAEEAVPLFLGMLRGLAAVHGAGAIHRDIKPANILLAAGDVAKISDFGLAQSLESRQREDKGRRSYTGSVGLPHPGTPGYRSPEHEHPELLQPTSDIWSMGAVFFEVLTGHPWHRERVWGSTPRAVIDELKARGQWADTGERHGGGGDVPADEIPDWLDTVVARMLLPPPGRDANQRFDETVRWVLVEDVIDAVENGMAGVFDESDSAAARSGAATDSETVHTPSVSMLDLLNAHFLVDVDARMDTALDLLDAGDGDGALALLKTLRDAGYRSPVDDLDTLIGEARRLAAEARAREEATAAAAAREEAGAAAYAYIVRLSRRAGTRELGRAAWARYLKEYPERDDPEEIAALLGDPAVSDRKGSAPVTGTPTTEQQALLDVMLDSAPGRRQLGGPGTIVLVPEAHVVVQQLGAVPWRAGGVPGSHDDHPGRIPDRDPRRARRPRGPK